MRTLVRVIVKEFQQLRRDKKMIPAMIIGPLVQLLALGYAANNDVTDIPMVLLDDDHGAASRALVDRFTGSRKQLQDLTPAQRRLRNKMWTEIKAKR